MRSFYILIPTLAIANMGGANAQTQRAGAENIRSGVIQRAIAITGKRQVHSADFSSGGPSGDGSFIDPLRPNHGRKENREPVDQRLLAKRALLSSLTSGLQNMFGLSGSTASEGTASASADAGVTATAGQSLSDDVSGVVDGLGTLSMGITETGSQLVDTTIETALGSTVSVADDTSLGVSLDGGLLTDNASDGTGLSVAVSLPAHCSDWKRRLERRWSLVGRYRTARPDT
ncbi:hypothetical protein NMY22_g18450 [Coprinellus aureogranulatus]|nr:hypothetical protein NMY22_g18450 [Coprinellus aureogranulatus]